VAKIRSRSRAESTAAALAVADLVLVLAADRVVMVRWCAALGGWRAG
jgi:hypothetical protein